MVFFSEVGYEGGRVRECFFIAGDIVIVAVTFFVFRAGRYLGSVVFRDRVVLVI